MTLIQITSKEIKVNGHSGYAEYGKDIVCSAISTLIEATYNYLKATENIVELVEDEAKFEIKLIKTNENGKRIINEFKKMIDDIIEQYPEYVRREYEEIR